jgi:transposase-like protein
VESQNQEISALKKEKAETDQANEILKDALGFFVKDRKK